VARGHMCAVRRGPVYLKRDLHSGGRSGLPAREGPPPRPSMTMASKYRVMARAHDECRAEDRSGVLRQSDDTTLSESQS
jgi:hypothetical protein